MHNAMTHPRSLLLVALLCLSSPGMALGQDDAPAEALQGTGDAVVDARLADIDVYAARYRQAFIDELVRYFDAPRPLIEELLEKSARSPGDLYYACALARVTGRPCRGVLEARDAAGVDAGWRVVAAGLGVQPDGARAKRLRDGIEDSYVRWGRPLPDID